MSAHWPKGFAQHGTRHAACHVVDILPTILEVTGFCAIVELGETEVQAVQGESLLTLLKGADWQREQPIFFEHEGNSALRIGQFKLVRQYGMKWELYDMELFRTELRNLAAGARDQVRDMAHLYDAWTHETGVIAWEHVLPVLNISCGQIIFYLV